MPNKKPSPSAVETIPAIETIPEDVRCNHVTADNRRCIDSRAPDHKTLCPYHAMKEMQRRNSKFVAKEILGPLNDFRSAFAINSALGKLFAITAENRIPVRNAAVLAYIGQLLLQTLNPLQREVVHTDGKGGMDAILRDTLDRFDDELDRSPSEPKTSSKPTWRDQVVESLDVLRRAGFSLPDELVAKMGEEGDGEEGDDESSDAAEQAEA
jgi:hypothetical protein